MEPVKILQIVGFKNSGKTTLMNRFIGMARKMDKKTAAIKHHGHGGKPSLPNVTTDSMQFLENGAASSLVYGEGLVQIHLQEQDGNIEKLIAFSQLAEPDCILVEGFKQAPYPKVVLVRSVEDWKALRTLPDIRLVLVPSGSMELGVETIWREDEEEIARFFSTWMEGEADESI